MFAREGYIVLTGNTLLSLYITTATEADEPAPVSLEMNETHQ